MATQKTAAQLKAEIKEIRGKYDQIFAKGNISEADAEELRAMDVKLEELLSEYSQRAQDERRANDNREAMRQIFAADPQPQPTTDGAREPQRSSVPRSLGARFVQDPQFKSWHASLMPNGQTISDNIPVKSPVVSFDVSPLEIGALVTGLSDTSAGATIRPDRLPGITPLERDEITILDLLTRIPIESDAFEFVRVTGETNNAAPVAEPTSAADGLKPTSDVALVVVSGVVETIAHAIDITRRAASDARQIQTYVDEFLRWGVLDELANQVLSGNGTSPNLLGLANTPNTQSQAWSNNILETTRKARTLVRTVGKATPTAYLLSPIDWETIDLTQDNENRYFFGGPTRLGTPVLWGLPVVEEERQPAGVGWVAAWNEGLLFDREQTNVYMTDSHADYFKRNILVLLAELRAAFGVRRPKTFVEIDLTAV
jgi:HK97 family phage major capsid protein